MADGTASLTFRLTGDEIPTAADLAGLLRSALPASWFDPKVGRCAVVEITWDAEEAMEMARSLASCIKEGEDDGEGEPFVMENDDAFETLHHYISGARALLDLPVDNPHPEDACCCSTNPGECPVHPDPDQERP